MTLSLIELPTHRRDECAEVEQLSISLPEAPTLSPTKEYHSFGHEDQASIGIHNGGSFLTRHFGSLRPQETGKVERERPLGLRSVFCASEPLVDLVFVCGPLVFVVVLYRHGLSKRTRSSFGLCIGCQNGPNLLTPA